MSNQAARSFIAARDRLLDLRQDQPTARAAFQWPEAAPFNWALDYFDDVAARVPDRPALVIAQEDGTVHRASYADLSRRSAQVANWLHSQGLRRGDRLLLMLPNIVPLWEITLAAMKMGAVIIPATTLLDGADLADRLERGQVRGIIATAGLTARFDAQPGDFIRIAVGSPCPAGWAGYADAAQAPDSFTPDAPTQADDTLLLYFTSGTTAKPKLVRHTHRSYPVGHLSTMYWLGLRPGDVHWNISSPGWAKHAWSNIFAPWNAEATVFVYAFERFQAGPVLDALVAHRVTSLCAPPTVWRLLMQEDLRQWPVALRELCGAGEPLNPEVIARVQAAWGLTIRDGFGQTETTAQVGNAPGQPVRPGSMGRPLPGYDLVLLDPDGNEADEGEMALRLSPRPAGLMAGYEDAPAPEATGAYYRTGDVASRDADGYLTYVGRADDVFKASDYRISPFELESALIEHPAVAEAAIVPSPDPLRLAVPKAFIILAPGHEAGPEVAQAIFRHIRAALPPYKRVRRLEIADLPKTISGKIRRVELRRQEQARDLSQRHPLEYWEEDFPDLASKGR
ncbi:AMP-binding protein [Niveispirillum fermenti]|uniref:AMP-binding protein n=1 Tax=Niveispirillum fermenti TaxID=1233113 RepID=UPI003A8C5CFD